MTAKIIPVELLRIGIIGAGGVARSIHLPGFALCPQVEIGAVCDPDADAARSLGVAWTFQRVEDLLALRDVNAVVVATPNQLLLPWARQSEEKGIGRLGQALPA